MTLLQASVLLVLASLAVALPPMRYQFVPGVALLLASPVLIVCVGASVGWWAVALTLAAFYSMYRNPLRYFWACARGLKPELPK